MKLILFTGVNTWTKEKLQLEPLGYMRVVAEIISNKYKLSLLHNGHFNRVIFKLPSDYPEVRCAFHGPI